MRSTRAFVGAMLVVAMESSFATVPDCAGPEDWPALAAFAHLEDARVTSAAKLEFTKTRVLRLASEPREKGRHRQLHLIAFTERTGQLIHVITASDASDEFCAEGPVEVFVLSRKWADSQAPGR